MKITDIKAIEILDSRGKPTVRTFITLENNSIYSSSVPSGASTGKHEAVELRDGDTSRHHGQGVLKAVDNVNTQIKKKVVGMDVNDIEKIDQTMLELDGTDNKAKLGANAILSVSQAAVRAAAASNNMPLWEFIQQKFFSANKPQFPRFMTNLINGGKHAQWNFDIQEFIIIPRAATPSKSAQIAAEIFQQIGKNLKKQKMSTLVGDEGGYSPALHANEEAFSTIITAAEEIGYKNGQHYDLAIDAAASEFYQDGRYILKKDNREVTGDELIQYYLSLKEKYSIYSFEDIFEQDDWDNWSKFKSAITHPSIPSQEGKKRGVLVVGDDLTVTNPKRIQTGINKKACNGVIIKLNQIGTFTESIKAIQLAKTDNWKIVVSHRSGETEDSFIADLAYGSGADFIKTGSMSRSERLCKYNRLIEIENQL